ncbi:MAG TPA: hypothetical protein VJ647_02120 [Chitinophagaceae bacterium]|nr:hypothetical protein [Chitinophagaceae bacterium]
MQQILLYIDPGSGSYLIQMIIAAVLGALFYFKSIWWKIKSFFTRNKPEDSENKEEDND